MLRTNRQTNKQTDGLEHITHAVGNKPTSISREKRPATNLAAHAYGLT